MSTRLMPNASTPSERRTSRHVPVTSQSSRWTSVTLMATGSAGLGVVARAVPIDDDGGLVAHDPRVVAARQRRHVSRAGHELGSVVHPDREPPAHVVLEVGSVARVGSR